jgi:hypothetical protein
MPSPSSSLNQDLQLLDALTAVTTEGAEKDPAALTARLQTLCADHALTPQPGQIEAAVAACIAVEAPVPAVRPAEPGDSPVPWARPANRAEWEATQAQMRALLRKDQRHDALIAVVTGAFVLTGLLEVTHLVSIPVGLAGAIVFMALGVALQLALIGVGWSSWWRNQMSAILPWTVKGDRTPKAALNGLQPARRKSASRLRSWLTVPQAQPILAHIFHGSDVPLLVHDVLRLNALLRDHRAKVDRQPDAWNSLVARLAMPGGQPLVWRYAVETDPMTDGVRVDAQVPSSPFKLKSPYKGKQVLGLHVTQAPATKRAVFFELAKGQYETVHSVLLRFDQGKPKKWEVREQGKRLYINDAEACIAALEAASLLRAEVIFYSNGPRVLSFPVTGLRLSGPYPSDPLTEFTAD